MYEEKKREILAELRRDTNGAVVSTMFDMIGGESYMSYGVTVPGIKAVAQRYAPDHHLALALFSSKIREMKLCAIYIDTADEVTSQQMELWSESFDSQEIAEHCCSMLFYKANDALKIALSWMDRLPSAALLIAARRAKTLFCEEELEKYLLLLDKMSDLEDSGVLFNAKCQLLVALSRSDASMREKIQKMALSDKITEEIRWQIEF